MCLWLVVIECITCDDGSFHIRFSIELEGNGLLAFTFVLFGLGGLFGEADCHGRSSFVFAQAQAQCLVTYPFSINGKGAWERAQIAA